MDIMSDEDRAREYESGLLARAERAEAECTRLREERDEWRTTAQGLRVIEAQISGILMDVDEYERAAIARIRTALAALKGGE